jgi:hypothetical protein
VLAADLVVAQRALPVAADVASPAHVSGRGLEHRREMKRAESHVWGTPEMCLEKIGEPAGAP